MALYEPLPVGEFKILSRNFVAVCLANFFYFGSFYFLIPTLPQYVALLHGTPEQIGLVMGLFPLASVVIRPSAGRYADLKGRKLLMLFGSGLFVIFPIVYNFLSSIPPLYAARVLHGLVHGCFLASSMAYVADLAPPEQRGEVIGIFGTSNVIAMALFPAWANAIVAGPGDFPRMFLFATLTALAGFLCVLLLTDIRPVASQGAVPAGTWEVGRRREVIVPSVALFAGASAYGMMITFLPVFAPQRGLEDFGIFFTVYAASTILSRVLVGRLSDRIGRRKVIIPFMILLVLATGLLPSLHSKLLLVIIAFLFGMGFGAYMPALNALVVDLTLPRERGTALAFFSSFMDVGITTGSMVLGLVGGRWGMEAMFYLGTAIVVAGALLFAVCAPGTAPETAHTCGTTLSSKEGKTGKQGNL